MEFLKQILNKYLDRFRFAFDLPFPRNKVRIRDHNVKSNYFHSGYKYLITQGKICCENSIRIDNAQLSGKTISSGIFYYADGKCALKIIDYDEENILVEALNDSELMIGKALTCGLINTDADIAKLASKICEEIDFAFPPNFFLSFVSNAEEIETFKRRFFAKKPYCIVPKIEAVKDLHSVKKIVKSSEGVVLARGDMALFMEEFNMLEICRKISKHVLYENKRLFAATDILSTLENQYIPSRSEILDLCLLKELGCTDIIIPNNYKRPDRFVEYVKNFYQKNEL